jgi:hypothetical protein
MYLSTNVMPLLIHRTPSIICYYFTNQIKENIVIFSYIIMHLILLK